MHVDPASDIELRTLAGLLVERIDAISEHGVERIREEAPEWVLERQELQEVLRSGTRASIEAELLALRDGGAIPAELPEIDAEGARFSARVGVPLDLHLFLYRIGHAVQWQAWFELVEGQVADTARRRALLGQGSRFFFEYADRLIRLATDEYQRERERLLRGHEQRRVHVVRELLDGGEVDATALDYPLDVRHLAVVASGDGVPAVLRELADALGRQLLLVELLQDTWWGWLGGRRAVGPRLVETMRALRVPVGVRLALGDELSGVDGFRESHAQAAAAHRVSAGRAEPVTLFDDVALEALAGRDQDDARRFLLRELRGIDGSDERSLRLRETLEVYFAHDQNAAATAAALDVHDQTVTRRLRMVGELTGRLVAVRRAELETALRLRRCLQVEVPPESS